MSIFVTASHSSTLGSNLVKNAVRDRVSSTISVLISSLFTDCDNVFEGSADTVDDSECTQSCAGNTAQLCGAPNRLSVYTSGTAAVFPTQAPSVGSWESLGCFRYLFS